MPLCPTDREQHPRDENIPFNTWLRPWITVRTLPPSLRRHFKVTKSTDLTSYRPATSMSLKCHISCHQSANSMSTLVSLLGHRPVTVKPPSLASLHEDPPCHLLTSHSSPSSAGHLHASAPMALALVLHGILTSGVPSRGPVLTAGHWPPLICNDRHRSVQNAAGWRYLPAPLDA